MLDLANARHLRLAALDRALGSVDAPTGADIAVSQAKVFEEYLAGPADVQPDRSGVNAGALPLLVDAVRARLRRQGLEFWLDEAEAVALADRFRAVLDASSLVDHLTAAPRSADGEPTDPG